VVKERWEVLDRELYSQTTINGQYVSKESTKNGLQSDVDADGRWAK
jgi:hypothetical protein